MLTLDEVKQYLHLDGNAEDEYLETLIRSAIEMCENYTRLPLPEVLPDSYKIAMLMCIGYFFEQREGSIATVPRTFYTLLAPYRKAVF